jgi:hypothetical protein
MTATQDHAMGRNFGSDHFPSDLLLKRVIWDCLAEWEKPRITSTPLNLAFCPASRGMASQYRSSENQRLRVLMSLKECPGRVYHESGEDGRNERQNGQAATQEEVSE